MDDEYQTGQDTVLTVSADNGVGSNDLGFDARRMFTQIESMPGHGEMVLELDGGFTYTPAAGFVGQDSFTYSIAYGDDLETEAAIVSITVTTLPGAPSASDDDYQVDEDAELTVAADSGVLANDSDPDGDSLIALMVDLPAHGAVNLANDGSFHYVPEADFFGEDSFTYGANDGELSSVPARVQITVQPQPDAPRPEADSYTTDEDVPLDIEAAAGVLSNDLEVDGEALTAILDREPSHGVLTLESDGSFNYQPEDNFNGTDSFGYRASDGALESLLVEVSLTITAVNDAPDVEDLSIEAVQGETFTGLLSASDVEGDPMTFHLGNPPEHGSALIGETSGGFHYTADGSYTGPDSFTFTASDGMDESLPATVNIDVVPPPPPEIERIFPEQGTTGRPLQIWGKWFGELPGSVSVGGREAEVKVWSKSYVTAVLPLDYAAGIHKVVLTDSRGLESNAVDYRIVPWIFAIDPEIASSNTQLTISGDALGDVTGSVTVAGMPATISSWSNTAVDAQLPDGLQPGPQPLVLTTAEGAAANVVRVTVPGSGMWLSRHFPLHNGSLIWTGTELLLWTGAYYGGSRYDPVAQRWSRMSKLDAPNTSGPAVWTGTEMLVWGGETTGADQIHAGRYDPAGDVWDPLSATGGPAARVGHSLIWTGNEMLVWGGKDDDGVIDHGKRYSPENDQWESISNAGAPPGRWRHQAVWTGSHMVVWGGDSDVYTCCDPTGMDTGGRYHPATDTWQATSLEGAPLPRYNHAMVWTGTEVLVVGGRDDEVLCYGDGGRYDPLFDSWTPMAPWVDTPPSGQASAARGVWTGTYLALWDIGQGHRYDPRSDSWTELPAAQERRAGLLWTGADLLRNIFVDQVVVTQRLDTASDSWVELPSMIRDVRTGHSTIWTGDQVVIWGGEGPLGTGVRYQPEEDSWTPTSTAAAPAPRRGHAAVWTGSEMIIWGGCDNSACFESGGRWTASDDSWTPTSTTDAPSGRFAPTAVWTGSEMIVWGGGNNLDSGGVYNPADDSWRPTNPAGAPAGCTGHTAVWTGTEMIIWGCNTEGALYDPASDSWRPMSTTDAPEARIFHTAVWADGLMIVWGGDTGGTTETNTGATYDPSSDTWTTIDPTGAPEARSKHVAVWTGSRMIVFAGQESDFGTTYLNDGGMFDPGSSSWTPLPALDAPPPSPGYSGVWTGTGLVVTLAHTSDPVSGFVASYRP